MFSIRAANPQDQDDLVRMWAELISYHQTIEAIRPARWSGKVEEGLRSHLAKVWDNPAEQMIFLADEANDGGQKSVGFIRLAVREQGPCPARIETLWIDSGYRGCGIGQALVEAATQWCWERGIDELSLEVVHANIPAQDFYQHLGYQPLTVTYMRKLVKA